ncbi:ABC transporter ATP-binding protein [Mycoplasmopsis columbina]|uniref:ABC transporter ATP-binding protein n=1 Tax=Mycoplasmopsis columbina TaxID=114881 RepID=UPI0009DECEDE|nr:ABC transporter ATP-binding protein [Mycoplasmopsis columbina]VEU77192.1 ABC transporter [Mycoplasmopsis columbina]
MSKKQKVNDSQKKNLKKKNKSVFSQEDALDIQTKEIELPAEIKKQKITTKNVCQLLSQVATSKKNIIVPKKISKALLKLGNKKHKKDNNATLKNKEGNIIDVQNVTKYYINGNVINHILDNISLSIKKGEIILIFGVSGGGKSTLLNLISGLDRPNSGNVIVCDKNLPYLSNAKLTLFRRHHVSFIFQSYNLLENLSAYDNAETGSYLQRDHNKRVDIVELFEQFELKEEMNKFPSQMSGGQQQRVSIIRALAKNADIIFADEPTGALDTSTSKIVLKTLYEINQARNTTVIMVSHDPKIKPMANRIITIAQGKISNIQVNEKPIHPDKFYK